MLWLVYFVCFCFLFLRLLYVMIMYDIWGTDIEWIFLYVFVVIICIFGFIYSIDRILDVFLVVLKQRIIQHLLLLTCVRLQLLNLLKL